MPDRIIRESALTSESLAKLTAQAERLFWRLTMIADDTGRFDASPLVVKGRCFPLLIDTIKTIDVVRWMGELTDCIVYYTVNSKQYGAFRNWAKYQRVYGNKPKFPEPPADCGEVPQVPALNLNPNRESIIDKSIIEQPTAGGFEKFWDRYPRKKSKGDARKAWAKLKPNESLQDRILRALERARTSDDWTKDGGKYIPYPASWLNAEGWDDEHKVVVPFKQPARATIVDDLPPAQHGEPCPPEVAEKLSRLMGKMGGM